MPDFGIFRGFNEKLFGDKLYAGQLPTQLGLIGSESFEYFYLLDDYPNAAAAYSLRLLRSAYTGSAIRVRIDTTGNPEYNIGFVDNELDVATLEGYCTGGLNAFVKTWYDQSGNGYNATQETAANQPHIVSSGSVILENGKPSVDFDGSNDYLTTSLTVVQPMTHIAVAQLNTNTSQSFPVIMSGSSLRAQMYNQSTFFGMFAGKEDLTRAFPENSNQNLHFGIFNGASSFYALNSSNTASGDAGSSTISFVQIGSQFNGAYVWDGMIQEAIIYNSNQSTNRSGIETNINNFYSIY